LHLSSDRSDNEFLTFNAGTLDPGTANSELFGHVPGAYTGAVKKRDGLFRKADHGTLFLDEIGNIPLELQGRLLRAVEYGEVTPVGDENPIKVDTRVFAATNKPLEELATEGKFLPDLVDRFSIQIHVPPLRECGDDCVLLAETFLQEEGRKQKNIESVRISEQARRLIRRHHWPGNAREVLNHARTAVTWAEYGAKEWEVRPEHLNLTIETGSVPHADFATAVPALPNALQALADLVLDALLMPERKPVLDPFYKIDNLRSPATLYFVEQLELGLRRFLDTDVGETLLRSKPNGAILAECFNLPVKTDSRKKSFARLVRDRLNQVLDDCRKNLGLNRSGNRRPRRH